MRLDDEAAERLSCNAATLDERLSGAWYTAADLPDQALLRARLERWRTRAAEGDCARFRRLPHVGPDEPALLDRLGPVGRLSPEGFPSWVQTLRAALDDIEQAAPDSAMQSSDEAARLPFSHALAPFVGWASRQVAAGAADSLEQLSPRALADLERALLARLCGAVGPCLQTRFSLERILHHPRLVLHPDFYQGQMGEEVYATFIAGLRAADMLRFFEDYPAAARLLGVLLEQWITSVTELLERLRRDRPELDRRLGLTAAAPVASIEGDVSDPHNGGRSVLILTFPGGQRLVYKPRSVTPEVYFSALIDRLSELGLPRLFPRTFALERPGYGWVEYVERRDCGAREEVDAYYGRLGALLAVFYALGASDLHHENLIAHGAFPVPIDLETLLCPRQQGHTEDAVRTVLCVGMLLSPSDAATERRLDLSAIGDGRPLEQDLPFGEWRHVNRDNMHIAAPQAAPVERRSLPRWNGVARHAHDHAQAFIAGFCRGYRALVGAAPRLLAGDGARCLPEECAIRVVFRDTETYASILRSAQEPAVMTAGVDRSIELQALFQPLAERPELHPLVRAEQQSLEDLDIPYLWVTAGGRDLRAGDKVIAPGFFAASGIEVARARLARLSEQDLEHQVGILKASLCAPRIREAEEAAAPRGHVDPAAARAIDAARKIAARIRALALPGDAPRWRWVAPEVDGSGKCTLKLLGPGLYDGTAGVGLFFAALSRLTGDEADRRMAFEVLAPARALLRSSRLARWIETRGVGVATGIGSILYALLASGRLLEDRRLAVDAAAIAAFAFRGESEGRLDLSSGEAGAVLALVALYRETLDEQLLRLAIKRGDALLEAWRAQDRGAPIHRRGLLHGVDGVWLALRRLSLASGAPRFREAAGAAERTARPLSAPGDRPGAVRMSWCGGLSGVTLGQIASMPAGERTIGGATRSIEAIAAAGPAFVDPPCCGTLSRVELLLYAGQRLERPELVTIARGLTTSIAERARRGAVMTRFPMHHPGFFRGLAGVGYELLRATFPEQLPSVLAFE